MQIPINSSEPGRPTQDGDDDDGEVEDVPGVLEVVDAVGHQLEKALEREDGHEELVGVVQKLV